MTADAFPVEPLPATVARARHGGAQAGYFGPAHAPRFAWLHRPDTAQCRIGLVIVPAFGYEAVCSRRALKHLAEDAARAGMLALRVDLDGTGDSAGDDFAPERVDAWIASIGDACDLARSAGAQRLVLVGIRLGATLATIASQARNDIAGLVAIAGVSSGKRFLREGKMLQMALGLTPREVPALADVHEIAGFALTAQTRAALSAIDLTRPAVSAWSASGGRGAPPVLMLERDDLPSDDAWVSALRASGAIVDVRRVPGYVEMMLDPHRNAIPRAMIGAAVEFAQHCGLAADQGAGAPHAPQALRMRMSGPINGPIGGPATTTDAAGTWVEEAVAIDDCVFGIATWPQTPVQRAVLLLNAGAVAHHGPNRLHVALARRLAALGFLVLRFDQSGLGDSQTRPGNAENVVYGVDAIADIGRAVAWSRQAGASEVVLAGLCSGAYHALRAGLADQPVNAIIAINPLAFHYTAGASLEVAPSQIVGEASRYASSVRSLKSWKKVLRGEVNLFSVARTVASRVVMKARSALANVMRRLHVALPDDLGSDLLSLAGRGIALHFIFAASDPGLSMLREEGGSAVDTLLEDGRLDIAIIEGADHTFTPLWSHPLLIDTIMHVLGC
ncbi:serine aminopeptidase domain-containing protein [Luteimonas sp. RIT-PG2_3]